MLKICDYCGQAGADFEPITNLGAGESNHWKFHSGCLAAAGASWADLFPDVRIVAEQIERAIAEAERAAHFKGSPS